MNLPPAAPPAIPGSTAEPARRPIDWAAVRARLAASAEALAEQDRDEPAAEAIFRRRARQLARPPEPPPAPGADELFLVLRLSTELYGVSVAAALEVVARVECMPLPAVPAHVCGLINVRSRVLAVVDLPTLWRVRPAALPAEGTVVLLDVEGVQFGLRADEVLGLRTVRLADLTSLPVASGLDTRHLRGVAHDLLLLDLPALLPALMVDDLVAPV